MISLMLSQSKLLVVRSKNKIIELGIELINYIKECLVVPRKSRGNIMLRPQKPHSIATLPYIAWHLRPLHRSSLDLASQFAYSICCNIKSYCGAKERRDELFQHRARIQNEASD